MVEYTNDGLVAYVDGIKFNKDKRTGYFLSTKPIGRKRKRLHVYVWEKEKGELPCGYDVHHKDCDKNNNDISNLILLTRSEHKKTHEQMLTEEQKDKRRRSLIENAVPLARAWHSTEQGIEWHREHGKRVAEKRPFVKFSCDYCGKEYESRRFYKPGDHHFCSNKCKSAFRRESGVDDVLKICKGCGCEFKANKYQMVTFCPGCSSRTGRRRKRLQHGG